MAMVCTFKMSSDLRIVLSGTVIVIPWYNFFCALVIKLCAFLAEGIWSTV